MTESGDPPAGNTCECGGTLTRDGRMTDGRQRWRCRGKCKRYEARTHKPEQHTCPICKQKFQGTSVERYCSDPCRLVAKKNTARNLRKGSYGKLENARRRSKRAAKSTSKPRGVCKVCLGPVGATNQIGVCTRNAECAKVHRQTHDAQYDQRRREARARAGSPSRIDRGYPNHPWELTEDGIIDYVAVDIAARGLRHVRLTPTEQRLVIERMLRLDHTWKDICTHLGIGTARLTRVLGEMGYEVLREPSARYANRRLITPVNRPRGPKLLAS